MGNVFRLKLFELTKQQPRFRHQRGVAGTLQPSDQSALARNVLCPLRHVALYHL